MTRTLKTLAVAAALCAGASGVAMAQTYVCPGGYVYMNGVCQTVASPAGIVGGAVGTAGAIAGGALDAAGNIAAGTVGAVTGTPPAYYGSSYPAGYASGYPVYAGSYPVYDSRYPAYRYACPSGYHFSGGGCYHN